MVLEELRNRTVDVQYGHYILTAFHALLVLVLPDKYLIFGSDKLYAHTCLLMFSEDSGVQS